METSCILEGKDSSLQLDVQSDEFVRSGGPCPDEE